MKLSEIYRRKGPVLSFEVFPPKPETPLASLYETIGQLKDLKPSFISVTYGAGGSQKGRTVEIASRIKNEYGLEAMAHLTCVGHTRADVDDILTSLKTSGVENVLALRGDPPQGQPNFDFSKGEFRHASELVEHICRKRQFCVVAAAYPEGHRASRRIMDDWRHLKEKVDAGAEVLITQLFYDNRVYYHFLETVRGLGIQCPIIPGIMPIFNARQIRRIMSLCGAAMPAEVLLMCDKYESSPDDMFKAGLDYTIRQIRDLLDNGAEGIHLEPMNRAELAREILKGVGWPGN